jgi:hypothetical protein
MMRGTQSHSSDIKVLSRDSVGKGGDFVLQLTYLEVPEDMTIAGITTIAKPGGEECTRGLENGPSSRPTFGSPKSNVGARRR